MLAKKINFIVLFKQSYFSQICSNSGLLFYCRAQMFSAATTVWLTQNSILSVGITRGKAHFPNSTPLSLSKVFFFLFAFFPPLRCRTPRGAQVSTQCSHIVVATRRHFSFFSLCASEAGESPAVAVGGFFLGGWHQTLFVCPAACL